MFKFKTFFASIALCLMSQGTAFASSKAPVVSYLGTGIDTGCLFLKDGGHLVMRQQELVYKRTLVDFRTVDTASGFFASRAEDSDKKVDCTLKLKASSTEKFKIAFTSAHIPTVKLGPNKRSVRGSIHIEQHSKDGKNSELVSGDAANKELMTGSYRSQNTTQFTECGTQQEFEVSFSFSWLGKKAGSSLATLNGPMFVLAYESC